MAQRTLALAAAVLLLAVLVVVAAVVRPDGEQQPLGRDAYREELSAALPAYLSAQPTDGPGLRQASEEFRRVVDRLTGFVPPPELAVVHTRLVSGLDEYARLLERLTESRQGAAELQYRLADVGGLSGFEWVKAMNELAAAGYLPDPPKL